MKTYGISPGPLNAGAALAPTLDVLASLGCTSVRAGITRSGFDLGGTYDTKKVVAIATELEKRGMTWLAGLTTGGGVAYEDPAGYAKAYAELNRVLDDYPNIIGSQTENEPEHFKADKTPTPARWVDFQKRAYDAAKTVAPGVIVVTGGLGGMQADWLPDKTCVDFLAASYLLGVGNYFDTLGFHVYSAPFTIEQSIIEGRKGGYLLVAARRLMVANGDKGKQIIVSEHAVPSTGYDSPNVFTEAGQARWLLDAHAFFEKKRWVHSAYWFTDKNHPEADPTDSGDWEGLLHADGSRKPAANAYESVVA